MQQLVALVGVFAYLSLLTIGGGMAAFPEMQTLTVNVFHWLTKEQLVRLYSVGQMAPGPNMMMIWRASIQLALGAVSIGLLLAGVISIAKAAVVGWTGAAIAAAVFAILMATHMNPLPLMALAALAGAVLFR